MRPNRFCRSQEDRTKAVLSWSFFAWKRVRISKSRRTSPRLFVYTFLDLQLHFSSTLRKCFVHFVGKQVTCILTLHHWTLPDYWSFTHLSNAGLWRRSTQQPTPSSRAWPRIYWNLEASRSLWSIGTFELYLGVAFQKHYQTSQSERDLGLPWSSVLWSALLVVPFAEANWTPSMIWRCQKYSAVTGDL